MRPHPHLDDSPTRLARAASLLAGGAALALALLPAACAPAPSTSPAGTDARPSTDLRSGARTARTDDPLTVPDDIDLGQGIFDDPVLRDHRRRLPNGSRPGGRDAQPGSKTHWGIVLKTFADENHAEAAATMKRELARVDATLAAGAQVHRTSKGSVVAYGDYGGPDDARAKRDLAWVKSIALRGRVVFPLASLSPIRPPINPFEYGPNELMSVRQKYPNVNPLYTLDVAVWGDFESGTMTWDQIKRASEAYAAQLRGRGFQAYSHHDPEAMVSSVTVGLFDHRAVDPQSGLPSADLKFLLDQFPARLVNGEELRLPVDLRHPSGPTKVHGPVLVPVPEL